jgi:hypothetical protein
VEALRLIPLVVAPTKFMERTPDQLMQRGGVPIKEWKHNQNALMCVVFKMKPQSEDSNRNVVLVFDTKSIQGSYEDVGDDDYKLLKKIILI